MAEQLSITPEDITVRSNWLYVQRRLMWADVLRPSDDKREVTPQQLRQVLSLGRGVIQGATHFKGGLWTIQLSEEEQIEGGANGKVLTQKGFDNGGNLESIDEIQEPFHPFWRTIRQEGFRPEVRRISVIQNRGPWITLRRPTLEEVGREWLEDTRISERGAAALMADQTTDMTVRLALENATLGD